MSDTLPNVIIPAKTVVDLYAQTDIITGSKIVIEMIGNGEAKLYSGPSLDGEPDNATGFYPIYEKEKALNDTGDSGAFIWSNQGCTIAPSLIETDPRVLFYTQYDCTWGIEPRLGTGPATYTCASTAQYSAACPTDLGGDPVGTIKTAAIDHPRIEKDGVLLGGAVTNKIETDLTDASFWINGLATVSPSSVISPNGTTDAYLITGNGDYYASGNAIGIINGESKYIWARTVSGTGYVGLLSHNSVSESLVELTEQWKRFNLTVDTTEIGGSSFYAADFRSIGATLTECIVWAPNDTGLPFHVNPIYGLNTTQAATNLTYPVPAGFDPALFTINTVFDVLGINSVDQTVFILGNAGLTEYVSLSINSSGNYVAKLISGLTDTLTSTSTITPNTLDNVLVIFDGTNFKLSVNEVIEDSVVATASPITSPALIRVGAFSEGVTHMFGHMKSLKANDYDVLAGA
jgi:hypothetical protein